MRCPICGSQLVKTIYQPPDNPDKRYLNFVCLGCRRRFRYAVIRQLRLSLGWDGKKIYKIVEREVIFNSEIVYFPDVGEKIQKVGDRFVFTAFGESMMLRSFKKPPFPLSELR